MTLLPPPLPNASATVWLKLMRLASPALPVGGFSYSEGLESAIEAGCVRDADSAGQWLLDQLHLVQQRCELPTMVQAHRAWACGDMRRVAQLNDWVLLTRETGVPCYVAENPMACVAIGAGKALENYAVMRRSLPES